ncbi:MULTISPECIES: DinB family protein [Paenibacillus]|uniref:DinB superfamily metal-dependent hydrolase n=1 Tax=Paenibacillus naphthalenovorans TaxID=162209 RepID=A0A0U2KZ79_9BACL|nr:MULTISPECIES: DinB family protein [Paenibacillus]ALS22338.1 DinB superfamily metal-dependent hydrolase [Paenibacillus naphthalenovorans]
MNNDWLCKLIDYHFWAIDAWLAYLKQMEEDVLYTPVPGVFPTIGETLAHLADVDGLWLSRLRQIPYPMERSEQPSIEELKQRFDRLRADYSLFLQRVSAGDRITYSNSKGEVFSNSILEVVQHLSNHGTYHLGNIASMMRHWSVSGASTDFIYYLRLAEGE